MTLNLSELLKGHEGITLYSLICGECTLTNVRVRDINSDLTDSIFVERNGNEIGFRPDGKVYNNGELLIFPSRESANKGYDAWVEWRQAITPKTWEDIQVRGIRSVISASIEADGVKDCPKLSRSALALMKIYQLIELGYGGVPTAEEWNDKCCELTYKMAYQPFEGLCGWCFNQSYKQSPIAFHSATRADEFLSHESNIQLLKEFFMI